MGQEEAVARQVKLWSGVIGAILLFSGLVWYCRWDGEICNETTSCRTCCSSCFSRKAGQTNYQKVDKPHLEPVLNV